MELDPIQISKRVYHLMQNLNYNQKEFAKALNITQPAVSKYLNGRIPPANVLLQLAEISRKNIEWILTGQSSIKPGYVAEKHANYTIQSPLSKKIERLPESIKKNLENLVDQMNELLQV